MGGGVKEEIQVQGSQDQGLIKLVELGGACRHGGQGSGLCVSADGGGNPGMRVQVGGWSSFVAGSRYYPGQISMARLGSSVERPRWVLAGQEG